MGIFTFLICCLIYAALYTAILLFTVLKSPRLLLDYYPEEIKYQVSPLTPYEVAKSKKHQTIFAVACVMFPFVVSCYNRLKYDWEFWQTALFSWRLMLFVSIYSLLVVDWLIFCAITPRVIVVPGSEGNKAYKNYNLPFLKFIRSLVIITGLSLFNAFIIHLKI